jgi:Domain of unknown function (DUF4276)
MKGIAIYVEGGGQTANTKADFRQGMTAFLRDLKSKAEENRVGFKLVACGGRTETYRLFSRSPADPRYPVRLLLVDSEGPIDTLPWAHLVTRDGWELDVSKNELIHLMVQTMETWIVADKDALERYYGQHFLKSALPSAINLESVPKANVAISLDNATKKTQKGKYQKIKHSKHLLEKIDPAIVMARCPHFARFQKKLGELASQE